MSGSRPCARPQGPSLRASGDAGQALTIPAAPRPAGISFTAAGVETPQLRGFDADIAVTSV